MNREIKFRAWDKNEKFMADWAAVSWNLSTVMSLPHIELMQYTGLKDKNGKEIYEGDIVRRNNNEELKTIVFNTIQIAGFAYQVGAYYDGMVESDDVLEVIGNIYSNPELLDNQKGA